MSKDCQIWMEQNPELYQLFTDWGKNFAINWKIKENDL